MALRSKRSMKKEDEETVRKLEPYTKVAKTWTIGGKTYTSKQFKALSPSEQKNLIELMSWEQEQSIYDALGIN